MTDPISATPSADELLLALPHYRTEVRPDWIDLNQHMGVSYYHLIMNAAAWHASEYWDFGVDYRTRTSQSSFILEMHARYLRELKLGDPVDTTVRILGLDDKRMHLWYEISNARDNYLAATGEALIISTDTRTRRVTPFAPDLHQRLSKAHAAHQALGAAPGPFMLRLDANGFKRASLD